MSDRRVHIEVMRVISAFLVVIHHFLQSFYSVETSEKVRNVNDSLGFIGVSLFFIISGYVIFLNLQGTSLSAGNLLLKRMLRIAPLYYLNIGIVVLLTSVLGYTSSLLHGDFNLWNIMLHILFLHNFFGDGYYYGINSVLWSLGIEVQFYFLFYLVLMKMRLTDYRWVFFLFVLISVSIYWLSSIYLPTGLRISGQSSFLSLFWIWMMGLLIAIHGWKPIRFLSKFKFTLFVPIGLLILSIVYYSLDPVLFKLHTRMYVIPVILSIVFICVLSLEFVANSFWINMGKMTYAIYLFHPLIILLLYPIYGIYNPLLLFLVYILGIYFLSRFLHFFVDKWFQKRLSNLFK
jgi:exopolysaccharide production protein ExoZ